MNIKASNGLYLCAEEGGGIDPRNTPDKNAITASREVAGNWEFFVEVKNDDGTISLKTANGNYVTAENGGGSFIRTDATAIGDWEKFTKFDSNKGTLYVCSNGRYYLSVNSSDNVVHAKRALPDESGYFDTAITIDPSKPSTAGLKIDGRYFTNLDGERLTIIECTEFQLLQRFLAGEDIRPIVQDRANLGFNLLRVLGMCANMFPLNPRADDHYYDGLTVLASILNEEGMNMEFTAFADASAVSPDFKDQMNHWERTNYELRNKHNVIIELTNENDHPSGINKIDNIDQFVPLYSNISSHGSNGSDAEPVRPWWQYETFHTNDSYEWWRKVGHNAMEKSGESDYPVASGVPVIANENTRPDRDNKIHHFYDAAAGAALLCAGSCFHSNNGKFSQILDDETRPFAKAWADGAKSVPLTAQGQMYHRRDDLLTAELSRVYQRGTDESHIVKIRK